MTRHQGTNVIKIHRRLMTSEILLQKMFSWQSCLNFLSEDIFEVMNNGSVIQEIY